MAKQGPRFNGGINLGETLPKLRDAWIALMGTAKAIPTVEAHRPVHMAEHGLIDAPERNDRALLLKAIRGCRACALGYVVIRLKVFEDRDVPCLEQAVRLKSMRLKWDQFLEAAEEADEWFSYEQRDMIDHMAYWFDVRAWPLERAPSAIEELERRQGRLTDLLLRDVVEFLRNGGFEWSEIVELVMHADGPAGAEKRMREALRIRQRKTASRTRRRLAADPQTPPGHRE